MFFLEETNNLHKEARVKVKNPELAMVSMLIGAFVGMLSETSLNIALPQLMSSLHINAGIIQWLVTGYMLVIGIVLPFSSLLSKWFTTRQIIIFGLVDFIIGATISAMATNFGILLLGRMIQGIATGLILPLMFTVAMQIFPPHKLGTAMGICALVIMLAPAIGPTLTGIILAKLSWHWIFWTFIPFLVIALFFAVFSLENVGKLSRPKIDFLSLIGSIIGFASLVTGISLVSDLGWISVPVIVLLIVSVITLTLYVRRQLTLENPVLNLKIFKNPMFRSGALLVMIDFAIILSAMYLLPQYIQRGLLLPVALTGIIMLPGGFVNAIVSVFAGRSYDNYGAKLPVRIGFLIAIIGCLLLSAVKTDSTIIYVIIAHVILMVGCPLAMSPAQTYALNSLAGPESGDGSTIMNTMQQIVGAISTALTTSFLALGESFYPGKNSSASFTNGMHFGIYFTLVLAVIGLLLSFTLKKNSHKY
ncbi:DHA2 family efflux MFS transporter permease subunit [Liquorilactobacillus mali]|uniref:Major facilitator superfamily permease n=1 Tax=Liquorilactobacillus mali KCTC 3596 = DSM 20444 TaxID=1046596 RepID=A0A0R2DR29_9LACO|nr:DHA2 family efflux MFS transporter permease subunit [Liquorilactobacillus mali]KRN06479.1 major facilitator superfamily permease [Liquorilactobacillus mali KCTC 3596 = DSM 20444]